MKSPVRLAPGWTRVMALAAAPMAGIAVLAAVLFYTSTTTSQNPPVPAPRADPAEAGAGAGGLPAAPGLLVHVSGAVTHPGLYRVSKGERVYAAIEAAGGLAPDADTDKLPNMAGKLKDGEQVKVPVKAGSGASKSSAAGSKSSAAGTKNTSALVDLNTADLEELVAVPGFDADLANAVIDYRTNYGGFGSIRELVTVLGMSEALYVVARKHVRV